MILVAIAGITILSRLPQLIGSRFLPDGDEAMIGVMAHHALHGEGIPLFIWGQRYGLVTPEVTALVVAFRTFGESLVVQHAAILLLWGAGVMLLASAVRRLGSKRQGLWVGVLMVACPGWLATSMKAWGTNVTGFLCSAIAVYALARLIRPEAAGDDLLLEPPPVAPPVAVATSHWKPMALAVVTGVFMTGAACANPFWLLFLLPIVATLAWRRVDRRTVAAVGAGGLLAGLVVAVAFFRTPVYWEPSLLRHVNPLQSLLLLPGRLHIALTGTYFLMDPVPAGPATALMGMVWMIATPVALVRSLWRLKHRQAGALETAAALSLAATLAITILISPEVFAFRYLLPAVSATALLLGICFGQLRSRADTGMGWLLVGSLVLVAPEFRHVSPLGYDPADHRETAAALDEVLAFLGHEKIADVYSTDPMLPWNVMLASDGQITARWTDSTDRHPAFPRAVDCAFDRGERTALIGRVDPTDPEGPAHAVVFENQFFVLPGVPRADLLQMGFGIGSCH